VSVTSDEVLAALTNAGLRAARVLAETSGVMYAEASKRAG
jgi:hypothetical protein